MKRWSLYLAIGTISCFLALSGYAAIVYVPIQRQMREVAGEAQLWATTQAEREATRLLLALTDPTQGSSTFHFELLYSRVDLMNSPPQVTSFEQLGLGGKVAQAMTLVEDLEVDLEDPAPVGSRAAERTRDLIAVLRDIAVETNLKERAGQFELNEAHRRALRLLTVGLAGLLLTGGVMAFLLTRNIKTLLAAQETLKQERQVLEQTVENRTLALKAALATETRAKDVYRSFVITVSHQLRSPLAVIQMTAQRQLRGQPIDGSPRIRRKFEKILNASSRLSALIESFLNAAQLDPENTTLSLVPLDMRDTLESVVAQIQQVQPSRSYRLELPDVPLQVSGDALLLEQVFLNLLANASKYSMSDAPIDIRATALERRICVTVTDQGIGVPQSAGDAIFEKHFRADNAHKYPGIGVGLSLARDIVQLHEGTIRLNPALSEGAEFEVCLPGLR